MRLDRLIFGFRNPVEIQVTATVKRLMTNKLISIKLSAPLSHLYANDIYTVTTHRKVKSPDYQIMVISAELSSPNI